VTSSCHVTNEEKPGAEAMGHWQVNLRRSLHPGIEARSGSDGTRRSCHHPGRHHRLRC